jgi:hypothetical protein
MRPLCLTRNICASAAFSVGTDERQFGANPDRLPRMGRADG